MVRLRSGVGNSMLLILPVLLMGLLVRAPQVAAPASPVVDQTTIAGAEAADRLSTAADSIERATGPGGSGFEFTVVARSTLYARPDGPRIEIPSADDPAKIDRLVDEYYVGSSIAEGVVVPDGFFTQMRSGPSTAEAAPDFDGSEPTLAGLRHGDEDWRNDGDGWYRSDALPGIGLDPATVRLLPKLLREAGDPTGIRVELGDGSVHDVVTATGKIADAPGLMGIDAAPFSVLAAPLEFVIDDQGRLVELTARVRNTNVDEFDLIVETVVTFVYSSPQGVPKPEPTAPLRSAPTDQ